MKCHGTMEGIYCPQKSQTISGLEGNLSQGTSRFDEHPGGLNVTVPAPLPRTSMGASDVATSSCQKEKDPFQSASRQHIQ